MLETVFTAAAAFIATNLDDLLVLMILFSRIDPTVLRQKRRIVAGHSIGVALLVAISLLGALGLKLLHWRIFGLLGLLPILLGLRALLRLRKGAGEEHAAVYAAGILASMLLTIANGADNIGVYIPLFLHYGNGERLISLFVFAAMNFLWCFLGFAIIKAESVQKLIRHLGDILLPVLLILLGCYILLKNDILALVLEVLEALG